MKCLASRTIVKNGRIITQHLVDGRSLGRGKSFWVGPAILPDPARAAHQPIDVVRTGGRRGLCSMAGIHGSRCHMAAEFGFCSGGCDEWLLREADRRSGDEIARALIKSALKHPQQK